MKWGYTLSSEEQPPANLVRGAAEAEDAGFDFCSISDHFHPWVQAQGHSPFVWSVLGAIAASTDRLEVLTGVTCPIMRIHPAVVAHAAATTSLLFGDRFSLGVGSGEALNEHILGTAGPRRSAPGHARRGRHRDPRDVDRRHRRLERRLLQGRERPALRCSATSIPIIVSGFGTDAAELAGRIGDGLFSHGTSSEFIDAYRSAGAPAAGTPDQHLLRHRPRRAPRPCSTSGPTTRSPANSPRTCPPGPTSNRWPSSSRSTRPPRACLVAPTSTPSSSSPAATSTRATTTSTSTRSAPTRTPSYRGGALRWPNDFAISETASDLGPDAHSARWLAGAADRGARSSSSFSGPVAGQGLSILRRRSTSRTGMSKSRPTAAGAGMVDDPSIREENFAPLVQPVENQPADTRIAS